MTKIDFLNLKLIVPDNYQQFLVHFEWFLALFHISYEKWLLSKFKQKVHKNGTFWSQNPFKKNFLGCFYPFSLPMQKNWVKILGTCSKNILPKIYVCKLKISCM